ncbi:MAG: hydrogenase iron-sulfur subunit [Candidatus Heimdallarchaeaceae archaeon]
MAVKQRQIYSPKVLVITTVSSSYPGADNAGQGHKKYTEDALIIRVPDPAMFKPDFYIKAFEKGFGAILVASGGTDSPFKNIQDKLSSIIDKTYELMQKKGIDYNRLKLTAICTVCADKLVEAIKGMHEIASQGPAIGSKKE